MKMNIPCRELKMVKRYAMTTVLSFTYMRPKAQVRPSRHSKAMAPITQDLRSKETVSLQTKHIFYHMDKRPFEACIQKEPFFFLEEGVTKQMSREKMRRNVLILSFSY